MQVETVGTIYISNIFCSQLHNTKLDIKYKDNEIHLKIHNFIDLLTLYNLGLLSKNLLLEIYMEKIDKIVFLKILQ